jgi:hypothetical protein
VSAFVKKCLLKKLRKRIDSELSATGESLHISVRVIEWNALNIQGAKRSLGIPLRDRNWFKFLPVSLAKSKPAGLINKAGECVFLV